MTTELDNDTLEWAAQWIEDSLKGETNERTVQFGNNMAMTLRAAKSDTRVSAASTAPLVDGDLISRQDAVRVARDHDLLHSSGYRCYEGEVIARKIAALPARTPSVATAAQIVSQAITESGFGDSPPPVRSWEDGKHGLLAAASPAAPAVTDDDLRAENERLKNAYNLALQCVEFAQGKRKRGWDIQFVKEQLADAINPTPVN